MGANAAVLLSLRRVFRAEPLPTALTLPLPLNSTPPPRQYPWRWRQGVSWASYEGLWRQKDHGNRYGMTCAGGHGNCLHEASTVVSEFSIVSADNFVWVTSDHLLNCQPHNLHRYLICNVFPRRLFWWKMSFIIKIFKWHPSRHDKTSDKQLMRRFISPVSILKAAVCRTVQDNEAIT